MQLVIAVIVSMLGIVNTLMISISERNVKLAYLFHRRAARSDTQADPA